MATRKLEWLAGAVASFRAAIGTVQFRDQTGRPIRIHGLERREELSVAIIDEPFRRRVIVEISPDTMWCRRCRSRVCPHVVRVTETVVLHGLR